MKYILILTLVFLSSLAYGQAELEPLIEEVNLKVDKQRGKSLIDNALIKKVENLPWDTPAGGIRRTEHGYRRCSNQRRY